MFNFNFNKSFFVYNILTNVIMKIIIIVIIIIIVTKKKNNDINNNKDNNNNNIPIKKIIIITTKTLIYVLMYMYNYVHLKCDKYFKFVLLFLVSPCLTNALQCNNRGLCVSTASSPYYQCNCYSGYAGSTCSECKLV